MNSQKYYDILELRPNAGPKEVKRAYLNLVRKWHPDRFFKDPVKMQRAQEKIKEINEAHCFLKALPSGRQAPAAEKSLVLRRPRTPAVSKTRPLFKLMAVLFFLSVLFLPVYFYSAFKEKQGQILYGGVAIREWEWERAFKQGSTKDEVLGVQGAPQFVSGEVWHYGRDWAAFTNGRVTSYSNTHRSLRVRELHPAPAE